MQSDLFQPWTTVRVSAVLGNATFFTQDAELWADFALFSGVTFWVDVADVATPATGVNVQLTFQTSPTLDEENLVPLALPLTLTPNTFPAVVTSTLLNSTVPLARWVRWQLTISTFGGSSWGATFRIRAVPSKQIPFTPIQLAHCVLWLRSDMGITLNGTNVSAWADQSPAFDPNKTATQSNTSLQPAFTPASSAFAGNPLVTFTGSQLLQTGTWNTALSQPATTFVVGNTADSSTSLNYYFHDGLSTGGPLSLYDAGTHFIVAYAGNSISVQGGAANAQNIICTIFNGSASSLAVNQRTPEGIGFAGTSGATGMTIGNAGTGGTNALNGPIAEVIVYSRVLSTAEIGAVAGYLSGRYLLPEGP